MSVAKIAMKQLLRIFKVYICQQEVHDHEHHHKQNFISNIFSLDHKMIATIFDHWYYNNGYYRCGNVIAFRMQLAWPEESLGF
jgi:hypothetical protein